MNQVAREARLAKGTLYLYFGTKEELFLALLFKHLQAWLSDVERLLGDQPPRNAEDVAGVFIESARGREPLRRLLLLLGTVLERNVSPEALQVFRREVRLRRQNIIQQLPLAPERGLQLLMHIYALSVGWHQVAEVGATAHDTEAHGLPREQRPPFGEEYAFAVRALVRGVMDAPRV